MEWSGVLFYDVEGSFKTNDLKIICKDILVLDIGTSASTSYDQSVDIITYADENNLLTCYQGLIHSHNTMATFFSRLDINTLVKEGSDTPHFVSLIVNNVGVYNAKITRRVTLNAVELNYPTFEGEVVKEDCETILNSYIEAFPLDIITEEDNNLKDIVANRIKELRAPTVKVKETKKEEDTNTLFPSYEIKKNLMEDPKERKKEIEKELNPFSEDTNVLDESWINIKIPDSKVTSLLMQIVTGCIISGTGKFNFYEWASSKMEPSFKNRFSDTNDLRDWFITYIDFILVYETDDDMYEATDYMKALAFKLLKQCEKLPENKVIEVIEEVLESYLEN